MPRAASTRVRRASERRQTVSHDGEGSEKDDAKLPLSRRAKRALPTSPCPSHEGDQSKQESSPNLSTRRSARSRASTPVSSHIGDVSGLELSPWKPIPKKPTRSRSSNVAQHDEGPSKQGADDKEPLPTRQSKRARRSPRPPGQQAMSPYLGRRIANNAGSTATALNQELEAKELLMKHTSIYDDASLRDDSFAENEGENSDDKPSYPPGSDAENGDYGAKTGKSRLSSDETSDMKTCLPAEMNQIEDLCDEVGRKGHVRQNERTELDETSENDEVEESGSKSPLHQDISLTSIPFDSVSKIARVRKEAVRMNGMLCFPENELNAKDCRPKESTANGPDSAKKSSKLLDVTPTCKTEGNQSSLSNQLMELRKLSMATPETATPLHEFTTSAPTCIPIDTAVSSLNQTLHDAVVKKKVDCFAEKVALGDIFSKEKNHRNHATRLKEDRLGEFTGSGLTPQTTNQISAVTNIDEIEKPLTALTASSEDSVEQTHLVNIIGASLINICENSDAKTKHMKVVETDFPSTENITGGKEPIEVDITETACTDLEITSDVVQSTNVVAIEVDSSTSEGNSCAKEFFGVDLMAVEYLPFGRRKEENVMEAEHSASEATSGDNKTIERIACTETRFLVPEEKVKDLGTQTTNVKETAGMNRLMRIDFQIAERLNSNPKSGGPKNGEVHGMDSVRFLSKEELEQDSTKPGHAIESEAPTIELMTTMVASDDIERKNFYENMVPEESTACTKMSTLNATAHSALRSVTTPGDFDRKSSYLANVHSPIADEISAVREIVDDNEKKVKSVATKKVGDNETRDIDSNKTESISNEESFIWTRRHAFETTPVTVTAIVHSNTKDVDGDCRILPVFAGRLFSHPQLPGKQEQTHLNEEINDHDPNFTHAEKARLKQQEARRERKSEKYDLIPADSKTGGESFGIGDISKTRSACDETHVIDTVILGNVPFEEAKRQASTGPMTYSPPLGTARTSFLVTNRNPMVRESAAPKVPYHLLRDDKTSKERSAMSKEPLESTRGETVHIELVETKNLYLISNSENSSTKTINSNAILEYVIAPADSANASKGNTMTDSCTPAKSSIDILSPEVWYHADNGRTVANQKNSTLENVNSPSFVTNSSEAKTLPDIIMPAKLSVGLSSSEVCDDSLGLSMAVPIEAASRSTIFDTGRSAIAESSATGVWVNTAENNVSGKERQHEKYGSAIEINTKNDQNGSTPSLVSIEYALKRPLMSNVMALAQSASSDALPEGKSAKEGNLEDCVEGVEMQHENSVLQIIRDEGEGHISNKIVLPENQEHITPRIEKHVPDAAPNIQLPIVADVERKIEVDAFEISPPSYFDEFSPCSICHESIPRLNLRKCKIKIFKAAVRVYRGQGVEKLFAFYWYNLSCYVNPKQAIGSRGWKKARDEINSFLITKKLRRLHNALILGIMQLTSHSSSPAYAVQDLPSRWKDRNVKWQRLGDKDMLEEAFTDHWKSMFTCCADAWSSRISSESLGAIERSLCLDLSLNGNRRFTELSSCLPGALAVDPLVRSMVDEGGLKVSENAIWLLIVAVREYVAITLKKTIIRSEAITGSQQVVFSALDTIDLFPKRKHKEKRSIATPCVSQANPNPKSRGCITALEIASILCARPSYSSIGGFESHLAYERCIQSSFDQVQTTSQAELDLVCHHISSNIENRGRSKRKASAVSRIDDSKNVVFVPPVFESSHQSLEIAKVDTAPHLASSLSQPHVSRSHAMRRSPGMGRGAKDLAALKARASTGNEVSQDSSPTLELRKAGTPEPPVPALDSSLAGKSNSCGMALSLPLPFVAPTQQVLNQIPVLPQKIVPVDTQLHVFPKSPKPSLPYLAKVDKVPMIAQPQELTVLQASTSPMPLPVTECLQEASISNNEFNATNSSPPRGIGGARGRGFGVKNLAAMRARSSSDKEEESTPPPGGNGSEQPGNPDDTSKPAALPEENAPQSPRENGGNPTGKLQHVDKSNRNSEQALTMSNAGDSERESSNEEVTQFATTAM